MARPIKNNADYFSHDADMRNDLKIKALRRKYKHLGYAIYNMLLEVLSDSDFFEYELSDMNFEMLAGDLDIDILELKDIIDYLVIIDLMQVEGVKLSFKTLVNRFEGMLSKRKRERKEVIGDDKPQSKVKKSKVNEIIVKDDNFVFIDLDLLKTEMLNSEQWIEVTAMSLHSDIETIKSFIPAYCLEQKSKGKIGSIFKEYKSHFYNWTRIQIEKKQPAKNGKEYTYNEACDMVTKNQAKSLGESFNKVGNKYVLK